MDRIVTKGILTVAVSLAAAALLASPATAHGRKHRECLAPNGTDDTEALQSALDRCAGNQRHCVVRLCDGRFQTAPLRVGGFRGTLRGAGRERTVIQALPDLQVNENPSGYWQDHPLEQGLDPWPYLLQFIGGRGETRDFTIEIPTPAKGQRPTRGWTEVAGFQVFELAGAILVTGRDPMAFDVKRVGIVAGDDVESDFGTTLRSGVSFRGLLFNPEDTAEFPVHPLRGRHRLSESVLVGMVSGVALGELEEADIKISGNHTMSFVGVDLLDASHSRVRAFGNRWDVEAVGFQAFLNIDGAPSEDNAFVIFGNRGRIGPFFGFGSGIFFQDPVILPDPGESRVIVFANELDLGSATEAAFSGIEIIGAGRLHVSWNRLRGRVDVVGVGIDQTTGCRVIRNDLDDLETGAGPDLRLGAEANQCVAVVGRGDVVVDEGTDNRIVRH